jgi:hypothetical protein
VWNRSHAEQDEQQPEQQLSAEVAQDQKRQEEQVER